MNFCSLETNDRLRIRITDSEHQRWEIPREILPRYTQLHRRVLPQNHSISPEDDHNSPENNIVSDPKSDLVFTLRRTTPFGFIVSRRSTGDILFDASSDASDAGTFLVFKDQYLRPPHPPLLPLWPRRAHQEDFQARPKPNADALEHRHPQLQP